MRIDFIDAFNDYATENNGLHDGAAAASGCPGVIAAVGPPASFSLATMTQELQTPGRFRVKLWREILTLPIRQLYTSSQLVGCPRN